MSVTNVAEAKAQLSRLIDEALAGKEVVIARHGKPMVKLVPYDKVTTDRDMSVRIWQGEIYMADDFDELPSDLLEQFEDGSDEPSS